MTTLSWDSQTLQQEHTWRAFALSAAAHTVLLAGLVWGVSISSQTPALVEAEIWTSLPQIAAPEPMEADESERVLPAPVPAPEPDPEPEIVSATIPPPKTFVPPKTDTPQRAPAPLPDKTADLKKQQQEARKKQEAERRERFDREVRQLQAGAGGTGSAQVNSGPRGDGGWVARTAARIRANTVFNPDGVGGNPSVEYVVELDPTGAVLSLRKLRPSGLPGFDEAVERAIRKSEPFPADSSGKVPRNFQFTHRLKD
ncbi:MAG: energy transducer TonB [Burkholderiales bacterium]